MGESWPRSVCLDLEHHQVRAFLHAPEGAAPRDTAILICPPFGWEEICSYPTRRAWAARLAADGYPVARFDFPGCGDSSGGPREPGLVDAWTATVRQLAGWLREETGAAKLTAIGISLGGFLALRALQAGAAVDDLALWGVPARGRALLRAWRAQASMIPPPRVEGQPLEAPLPQDSIELIGYLLDGQTVRDLDVIDLTAEAGAPLPRRVLLLGRDGMKIDSRLAAYLEAGGSQLSTADGPGYGEVMIEPEYSKLPAATIAVTAEWLAADDQPVAEQSNVRGLAAPAAVEASELRFSEGGVELRETTRQFPFGEERLFGVICEPAAGGREDLSAIFLSGGGHRHTGPNRAWVEAARRWAASGVTTVRLDLLGIGDAATGEMRQLSLSDFYAEERNRQVQSVLQQLKAEAPERRFVIVGLCSGAYWGLHAALAESAVVSAVLVNLYAFRFSEALVVERERRSAARAFRDNFIDRLRRGGFRRDLIMRGLRSLRPSGVPLVGSGVEKSHAPEIAAALDHLRDQGTHLLLMLGLREPLYDQLEREGFLARMGEWPNLEVEKIPLQDHIFRALWSQRFVHDRLDAALLKAMAVPQEADIVAGSEQA